MLLKKPIFKRPTSLPTSSRKGRSVGGAEGFPAFFAAVTPTFALRCDVEGLANDVAFTGLSDQRSIGVGTGTRYVLALLHTCLMTEETREIQVA